MLLKKIDSSWAPKENEGLKIGETVDITDYRQLVLNGIAVLVDEQGNELALPGQKFACPVCFRETESLDEFVAHASNHKKGVVTASPTVAEVENMRGSAEPNEVAPVEETVPVASVIGGSEIPEEVVVDKAEELKRQRLANLARGRAAKVAAKVTSQPTQSEKTGVDNNDKLPF